MAKSENKADRRINYEPESLFVLDGQEEQETPYQWDEMPNFEQGQVEAWKILKVRFRNEQDLLAFAEVVGQTVTPKTKGIWYPPTDKTRNSLLRWMHEDQIKEHSDLIDEVVDDEIISPMGG